MGERHELQVSRHGERRARQRAGLPKRAVERNAQRALTEGIGYREASGALRRYLGWLYERYDGNGNNIRIYGDKVWVFHDGILITVLNVPSEHRKAAVSAQAKRRAEGASAGARRETGGFAVGEADCRRWQSKIDQCGTVSEQDAPETRGLFVPEGPIRGVADRRGAERQQRKRRGEHGGMG